MDGMTGAIQERMRAGKQVKASSGHMMLNMNLWSTLYLTVAVFLTSEIWHFVEFVQRFPFILTNIFAFSILSALGQVSGKVDRLLSSQRETVKRSPHSADADHHLHPFPPQMFIFLTVTEFGPLPCSIMTTTRKFFTVLASVILFGNVMSGRQWIGTVLVCATT